MIRSRWIIAVLAVLCAGLVPVNDAIAQRFYSGSTIGDSQYSGTNTVDVNGRSVNAEGRAVDRYGFPIDDYATPPSTYRVPNNVAGTAAYYPAGSYYPGGYAGLGYMDGMGYSVGLGGYSGGYYSTAGQFARVPGTTYIAPPRTIVVGGVYPSRVVMNNATRGGVVEYTHNRNGYVYAPGSSYQTVISSGPSIFPTMSVVQPTQPATLIEARPIQQASRTYSGSTTRTTPRSSAAQPVGNNGYVTLLYPKDSSIPMSYVLNGTTYSIKPGYSQKFLDDRPWTIEFLRGGSGSEVVRYSLKEGTYQFLADGNGWDLRAVPVIDANQRRESLLPPSPASTTPSVALPAPGSPTLTPAPVPAPDL